TPDVNPFLCKRLDLFASFFNTKGSDCISCHGNAANQAYAIFPMGQAADATTCQNFKQRANIASPLQSLFYLMPQNMVPGRTHPVTLTFSQTDVGNIQNWLSNEQ